MDRRAHHEAHGLLNHALELRRGKGVFLKIDGGRHRGPILRYFPAGHQVGRLDIDLFEAVMTREDRTKGFFVAFDYTRDALREIDGFFRKSGKAIIALTVREILDEEIARKLA